MAPNIDKGYSKTVKAHRPAIWQIKVKGEPPPTFKWFKDGQQIHHSPEFVVERKEFQGGAVAMLTISRTQVRIIHHLEFEVEVHMHVRARGCVTEPSSSSASNESFSDERRGYVHPRRRE